MEQFNTLQHITKQRDSDQYCLHGKAVLVYEVILHNKILGKVFFYLV